MAVQDVTGSIGFAGGLVTRLSTTLGWNGTPSTMELQLVEGQVGVTEDVVRQATGFRYSEMDPGSITGLSVGQLDFMGVVESWDESYSPNGHVFSVRLSDPRIIFPHVVLTIDGCGPTGSQRIANVLNPFEYYGNPVAADSNERGMSFNRIRQFLESSSGIINTYGKPLKLDFSNSLFASGNGIPDFYRVEGSTISLDQLLQRVASDFNFDFFAEIDYNSFDPDTSVVSNIKVNTVDRSRPSNSGALTLTFSILDNFGTLQSYKIGRELRSDPSHVMLFGSKKAFWQGVNSASANQIVNTWGRSASGTWIYNNNIDNGTGIIILDNIIGSGSTNLNGNTVQYTETNLVITDDSAYPPTVNKIVSTATSTGYYASEPVMRAALHSQQAWEAMLYKHNQSFAEDIGIESPVFKEQSEFLNLVSGVRYAAQLKNVGSGVIDRTDTENALINAVYEVTSQTVQDHYGKTFRVKLPSSQWLQGGGSYDGALNPRIEYGIGEGSFANGAGDGIVYPEDLDNHEIVAGTNSAVFKDDLGRAKSFVSIYEWDTSSNTLGSPVDLDIIPREQYIIEQGDKLAVPVIVEQDNKQADHAIISFGVDIQARRELAGDQAEFYEFLREFGYSDNTIENYGLLQNAGENQDFGLGPKKITEINSVQQNRGINISLESKVERYGPFTITGSVPGPVSFITDESLNPWSYGNYDTFNTAGAQLASGQVGSGHIVDSADFTVAGLPDYPLGTGIAGVNGNITSVTLQMGSQGLSTNYQLRTFALPQSRVTKILNDRIIRVYNDVYETNRQIIDLDKKIQRKEEDESTKVNTVAKVEKSLEEKDKGSTLDDGFIIFHQPNAPGGLYDPDSDNNIPLRS